MSNSRTNFTEFFELLTIRLVVFLRNGIEFFKVVVRYYRYSSFFKADILLRLHYLFRNPFAISKRFLMLKGEQDIYAYGETPLTTLAMIAKRSGITPNDCVYELGCGRGRGCFWLGTVVGCSVVGIEYIPEFIQKADRIKSILKLDRMEFRRQDFMDADCSFKDASILYLYGTCLEDKAIQKLIKKFKTLPVGTKIITVSYPLSDYDPRSRFEVIDQFSVPFTWGEGDVFVHILRKKDS